MITVRALNSVKRINNITDEDIEQLQNELNEKYDVDVSLGINIEDGTYVATSYVRVNSDFFKPEHTERVEFTSTNSFFEAASLTIECATKVANCEHSNHEPARTEDGDLLTNGMVVCCDCGSLSRPDYVEPVKGNKTLSIRSFSLDPSKFYVAEFDWKDTGVQAGDRGIVMSKNGARSTAFFEAFPTISGIDTFIRGEGDTVREAERNAWGKQQAQLACEEHEWTRMQGDTERKDGYAKCTKCGLSGTVLEPLTKCHICDTPTTQMFNEQHICQEHHNLLTLDQLLDEAKKDNQSRFDDDESFLMKLESQHEVDVENFEQSISLTFEVACRDERLKRGLPYPVKKHDMTSYHFLACFKENVFGIQSYERVTKIPKPDNMAMAHNLDHIKSKISEYVDTVEAGKPSFSPLIIGCVRVGVTEPKEPQS